MPVSRLKGSPESVTAIGHAEPSIFDPLEEYAGNRPEDIALQSVSAEGRSLLSFGQLFGRVRELSAWLVREEVKPGCHAAILMENTPQWAVTFLSGYSAGLVIVPLDGSQHVQALAGVVRHSACELLFCDAAFRKQAREIAEACPALRVIETDTEPGPGNSSASAPADRLPLVRRDPDADLVILYTGGTTGNPKGVCLSEKNIFITIKDVLARCPVYPTDNVLCVLPMFHVMPLLANLLGPLYAGARVTYFQTRDPRALLAGFKEEAITGFMCVPQFYYLMHRRILEEVNGQPALRRAVFHILLRVSGFLRQRFGWNAGKVLLKPIHEKFGPQFRIFGVGAATFDTRVAESMRDLGFDFFQVYGLTETCGPVTLTPPGRDGGLTCGAAMDHSEIRILHPGPDGIGEVLARGEHLSRGYWNDPEGMSALFRDGWLHTGDLGYLDGSGRLRITGRRKEVLVLSNGKKVFPEPLEFQLQQDCDLIEEVCVTLAPAGRSGEPQLYAVVVPNLHRFKSMNASAVEDRIRFDIDTACRSLPAYQRIHGLEIRTEPLPRTSTRKLKRFEIKPRMTKAFPEPVLGLQEEPEIFRVIREFKSHGPIERETNLEIDLGLDSIERVELFSTIESRFGLVFTPDEIATTFTAGELADLVATRRSEGEEKSPQNWAGILQLPLTAQEQRLASGTLARRPMQELISCAIMRMARLAARVFLSLQVEGVDRLPNRFPFIICANHASFIDAFLLAMALPSPVFRRLFFFGASKLARGRVSQLLWRQFRALRIDPELNLRSALRLGAEGLDRGLVLCVFPEGHRSIDGRLQPFRNGASVLALELGVPVVTVAIDGSHNVWARGSLRIRFAPVRIIFGPVIHPEPGASYSALTQRVFAGVEEALGRGA
jgi:long-chain acyl-CoA synthetase